MRQKVEELKSWEEVDRALLRVGQIDRQIEAIEARAQEVIEAAKGRAAAESKPLLQEKRLLTLKMEAFARRHMADLEGKRKKLNFGTISFRRSTRIVIRKALECVAALKGLGLRECIRVKESPDKERLRDLDDALLARVGAKRVTEEVFGYEVDREKVQEAA